MKKLILILTLSSGLVYGQETYNTYENGELFPSTTYEVTPQGTINVYDNESFNPNQPVEVIVPTENGYDVYNPTSPSGGWFPEKQIIRQENPW